MKIFVHPAASEELNDAAAFYVSQANRELGLALIAEFERVVLLLAANPKLGTEWVVGTQRFHLRRFPFSIVYRLESETLLIIAVAHQRRRPGYWRSR